MDYNLEQMLFEVENPMDLFKKDIYEENFKNYCEKYSHILDEINHAYQEKEQSVDFLEELSGQLAQAAQKRLDQVAKRRKKEELLLNYNMTLVVFAFPAMLAYQSEACSKLPELIAASWKTQFPKTNIQPADFETINKGFRSRFCYITTAVCESQNKPDDCYELNLLRDYRDHYVADSVQGQEMIRQYYDVAPTIVKHIDRQENRQEIYQGIWDSYLSCCIQLIESEQKKQCMDVYEQMVTDLKQKYFYS